VADADTFVVRQRLGLETEGAESVSSVLVRIELGWCSSYVFK
jgi:hypothetical protein